MDTSQIELALWSIFKLMRGELPIIAACVLFNTSATLGIYSQMRRHNKLLSEQNRLLAERDQLLKLSGTTAVEEAMMPMP